MPKTIIAQNQRINFRNFSGAERQYNAEGVRNFAWFLDEETAAGMKADGLNVKRLNPRDEDDGEGQAWIKVNVKYGFRPPKVFLVTNHGKNKTELDEGLVGLVDTTDIESVDIKVNVNDYEVRGEKGKNLYLASLYVNVIEDELDEKYRDTIDMHSTPGGNVEPDSNDF